MAPSDPGPRNTTSLTTKQLAQELNLTPAIITRLAREGRIPRDHFGHRTHRYCLESVREAIRNGSRADRDAPTDSDPVKRENQSGTPSRAAPAPTADDDPVKAAARDMFASLNLGPTRAT